MKAVCVIPSTKKEYHSELSSITIVRRGKKPRKGYKWGDFKSADKSEKGGFSFYDDKIYPTAAAAIAAAEKNGCWIEV